MVGVSSTSGVSHGGVFERAADAGVGVQPRSRRVAMDLVGYGDVLGCFCGGLAGGLAVFLRGDTDVIWLKLVQISLLTSLFCYLALRHFGFYDLTKINAIEINPLGTASALALGMITMYGLGLPLGARVDHSRTWYGVWMLTSFSAITLNRLLARHWLKKIAACGGFKMRLAIYGTGPLGDRIAQSLLSPGQQIAFAGAFDDRVTPGRASTSGPGACGGLDDLIQLGRDGALDQIIIALPQSADRRTADVARRLEQLPVSLHIVTHLAGDLVDASTTHHVSAVGNVGLIDIKTKPLADWGRYLKTVEDYVIASLALAAALPLMLLIAAAIKYDSPGPVLFRQRRHGLNRRVIEVLKFRSMSVMENGGEVQQASRTDARVTRIGQFLRKSSLDELPQLINVLRGDMSLIGPRPHALIHDDQYGEMLERYANRHQVKPGMTGWAQVNGFRGPTETADKMADRVQCDLVYIDRWSIWLDLKILAMTVVYGFKNKNAV